MSETVLWTQMADGNQADYQMLGGLYAQHADDHLVDHLIGLLNLMKGPRLGYQIDRYEHSLQSASRALRADEPIDLVVGALFHDVADSIAPPNHSATAAAILAPYVDDETHWVIKHHGLFQGYYYFHHVDGDRDGRDVFKDHEYYDACARFCANYDQNCFDPDYPNLGIDDFRPLVEEVFSRPSRVPGVAPLGAMTPDIQVN